jgi:cupin 2 domain-containing protein
MRGSPVKIDSDNIFRSIPGDFSEEIFTVMVESEGVRIERIVSTGQSSPSTGWYDQEEHEWVMVLEGEAVLSFPEAEDIRLKAGDYLNIPAHRKHRVSWTKPNVRTIWLAVFYK